MNTFSPYQNIQTQPNTVFLETVKSKENEDTSLLFINPVDIIQAFSVDEIPAVFQKIENVLRNQYYLAGYLSYECGYHFEELPLKHSSNLPLLWFGVYKKPIVYDKKTLHQINTVTDTYSIQDIIFSLAQEGTPTTQDAYSRYINTIKRYIQEGDVYQINYTGRMNFQFQGSPVVLFDALKKKQQVGYAAYLQNEHQTILSLSPELFFKRTGNNIIVRPMKGTAKRGRTLQEDNEIRHWLVSDKKNRAENVMIVDVLRNDLGKISEIGSVNTTSLYDIEKYDTLFQMTSTIQAQLRKNISYYEIFKAMFPSGSITGAPKRRAMEIIQKLESTSRGVYTGAIGYIAPNLDSVFNIAIRTVVLPQPTSVHTISSGQMGTGGGIVWDSNAEDELRECQLKAQFLSTPYEEFQLIETILWDNGFSLIEYHLERLKESCNYFDFPYESENIFSKLYGISKLKKKHTKYKIRLLLDRYGNIETEASSIDVNQSQKPIGVKIAPEPTNSNDRFLYHKTTRRSLYDEAFKQATKEQLADYIFLNERGEVTEGAISNIVIKKEDMYFTPPLTCGLLNGVYRRYLLKTLSNVEKKILLVQDLLEADNIYICNAVRGMREVTLIM